MNLLLFIVIVGIVIVGGINFMHITHHATNNIPPSSKMKTNIPTPPITSSTKSPIKPKLKHMPKPNAPHKPPRVQLESTATTIALPGNRGKILHAVTIPEAPPSSSSSSLPSIEAKKSSTTTKLTNNNNNNNDCYNSVDYGLLRLWNDSMRVHCKPPPTTTTNSSNHSVIRCRSYRHMQLPPPTMPHTICDGLNIVMDPLKIHAAQCVKNRPGYFCTGSKTYHLYDEGAFQGACKKTRDFKLSAFPRDHLMDIFESFRDTTAAATASATQDTTMFITRERGEHVNLFHTMTDWLNAFIMFRMFNLSRHTVDLVFLDDHEAGRFDSVWSNVFLNGRATQRASSFHDKTRFKHAIFSPPGYTSILFASLNMDNAPCMHKSSLLIQDFSKFMLNAYYIQHGSLSPGRNISIVFADRRAYAGHRSISRAIYNIPELIDALQQSDPSLNINVVDFANLTSFDDQMRAVAHADIFIGMHGAGMSHLLWLPDHGGVLELRHTPTASWSCYQHMAAWRGIHYRKWKPSVDVHDGIKIPAEAFVNAVHLLIQDIIK